MILTFNAGWTTESDCFMNMLFERPVIVSNKVPVPSINSSLLNNLGFLDTFRLDVFFDYTGLLK